MLAMLPALTQLLSYFIVARAKHNLFLALLSAVLITVAFVMNIAFHDELLAGNESYLIPLAWLLFSHWACLIIWLACHLIGVIRKAKLAQN